MNSVIRTESRKYTTEEINDSTKCRVQRSESRKSRIAPPPPTIEPKAKGICIIKNVFQASSVWTAAYCQVSTYLLPT